MDANEEMDDVPLGLGFSNGEGRDDLGTTRSEISYLSQQLGMMETKKFDFKEEIRRNMATVT